MNSSENADADRVARLLHAYVYAESRRRTMITALGFACLVASCRSLRVYSTLQSPAEHPLAARRLVSPPEYGDFGPSGVGFMALRGFPQSANGTLQMDQANALLDKYTTEHDVASVVWPNDNAIAAPNFEQLAAELARRKLGLIVGGFVPGGRQQYDMGLLTPAARHLGAAKALGARYLGLGQSEQDIRYLWGYAKHAVVQDGSLFAAYKAFRDYASEVELLSGNQLFMLARGVYPHHYLQTGLYTIAGAELSGGPPAQMTYAFIRGASKQHGTLLFSDVCTFTNWGHKVPGDPAPTKCSRGSGFHGPTCGTSYSAMKRLLFNTLMSDAALVGFESWLFYPARLPGGANATLSPMGRMFSATKKWAAATPAAERGVHLSTVAIFLDVFSGWETPCTDPGWQWSTQFGQNVYGEADYLADNIFELAYPGYRSAGHHKDASHELSPTPYGDVFDVLLSDAGAELLGHYDTVIVAHVLSTRKTIVAANLQRFVDGGGSLVLTISSLADLGVPIANVSADERDKKACAAVQPGLQVEFVDGTKLTEVFAHSICHLSSGMPATATVLATEGGETVAFRTQSNAGGSLTLLLYGSYGVTTSTISVPKGCQDDQPTETPRPLALGARRLFADAMAAATMFDLGAATNLSWTPTRVSDTEFVLGVGNTRLTQQPLNISATFGAVVSVEDVALDQSEKSDIGYLPDGFAGTDLGKSAATTIAGGDFRMLKVKVIPSDAEKTQLKVIPHKVFKRAPTKVWLRLPPSTASVRDAILRRPDFKQFFDGVLIDWTYVSAREKKALASEAVWMQAQKLSIGVDLSTGIDLFPKLRLGDFTESTDLPWNNYQIARGEFFRESMATIADVIGKASGMGATNVMLSLHGMPELGPNATQTSKAVAATLRKLQVQAAAMTPPVQLHVRHGKKNQALAGSDAGGKSQAGWLATNAPGLLLAPNTGVLAAEGSAKPALSPKALLLLDGSSALYDDSRHGTETAPLQGTSPKRLATIATFVAAARAADATVVLDASYADETTEQLDTLWLAQQL